MTEQEARHAIMFKKCLRCDKDLTSESVEHENGTTTFWMCPMCPCQEVKEVFLIHRKGE